MLPRQAITVLDHNCWILVDVDGKPYDPSHTDEYPHYTSKDDAEKGYASITRRDHLIPDDDPDDEKVPLLVPVEQDTPCYILTTVCGYVLDQEGDGICHEDDPGSLVSWALGMGWAILGDGRMVCCTDPDACAKCAAALALLPPPVEPTPGQLSIDGGELTAAGELLPTLGELSPAAVADLAELSNRARHA